jgi:hypothetical protein
MYGRPATAPGASPQLAVTSNVPASGSRSSSPGSVTPWVVLGLAVLFFIWTLVEHHVSRVRDAVSPQAIGINVRNIAVILLPVIIGVNVLKIAAAKYKAWSLPGADTAVAIIGNV